LKTDSLFYRLFQNLPSLLFELSGINQPKGEQYQFRSEEIKQTSFRLDGIFAPPESEPEFPLYFVEVQFQGEIDFYSRFFTEIFFYLRQVQPVNPWRAIVIYPRRSVDVGKTVHYGELLESERVKRIYLGELELLPSSSLGSKLVKLIVTRKNQVIPTAKGLVIQAKQENLSPKEQGRILDLIETIIVYKLPKLGREEIKQMLGLTEIELKETKFYQDVFTEGRQEGREEGRQEGRQEGEMGLLKSLLNRRFGELSPFVVERLCRLNLSQRLDLAEASFGLTTMAELEDWLRSRDLGS
jgi:predicted transposase/invertase (TIGR01784 family)